MMKRYVVFAGNIYYPEGGWEDFRSGWDELEDAIGVSIRLAAGADTWSHVVDLEHHTIVHREYNSC